MEEFLIARNPFSEQQIGAVPQTQPAKIQEIVAQAAVAQKEWQSLSLRERRKYFLNLRECLIDRLRDSVKIISQSTSKPYVEALSAELFGTLETLRWCLDSAPRHLRPHPLWMGRYWLMLRQSIVSRKPYGVLGIISPWNFPFGIPMGQMLPALFAGNAVVLKPSEQTPLVGLLIQELFSEAGFPENLVTIVQGGRAVGEALVQSGVHKILFTGSTAVGFSVATAAAQKGIPCTLELGGKDAMIVSADAHLEKSVRGALWGAFSNNGQVCASVERLYVHRSLYEPFTKLLKEKLAQLTIGSPETFSDLGAQINPAQKNKAQKALEQARQSGAVITQCHNLGNGVPPTLVEPSSPESPILHEEIFGPVLPIVPYDSDEEVVRWVNQNSYGLSASVWSESTRHAARLAARLEVGSVTINGSAYTHALPMTPWGGIKRSGWGTSHGKWGLEECTRLHHVHFNLTKGNTTEFWWFGYTQSLFEGLIDLVLTFTRPGKIAWLASLFPFLSIKREKKY